MPKAIIDRRMQEAGYVLCGDERIGFSPLYTVDHTQPRELGGPLAIWETNWGRPSRDNLRSMVAALRKEFDGRDVTAGWTALSTL